MIIMAKAKVLQVIHMNGVLRWVLDAAQIYITCYEYHS